VTGDPTKTGFDDSKWDTLKLNQSIYPDSCWIRKEVVIPERMLGERVAGKVRFLVSVDDYGYLWVNGESKGYFPWNGEFVLTENARPGDRFVIAIKAINTGGPLRLLRAIIEADVSRKHAQLIQDFTLSLRVGQKLLSFDTYQTNATRRSDPKTDRSKMNREEKSRLTELLQRAATDVDVKALESGNMTAFTASVDRVRQQLKPIGAFAKRFTLYFDSNAHIDAAWLWREKETVEVVKNTFTSVLNMMDTRPDFTYTQSAAAYYDWMEQRYPDLLERIRHRVTDGRWEVVGGMWVEPDCNLPAGESWMRHLLYAKRYFQKTFGVDVKIGWNPDSFGYNWNMPQFYKSAGIDEFITQKIGWNDTNVFPHRVFWWEAPDGSRILSYFPFDYVNEVTNYYRLVDWLRQFEANTGFTTMLVLFGVGDHGGGPSNEMLDRIEYLKTLDVFPAIEYGTAARYIQWLKQQDLSALPVWSDELYLEYHQGTFTTQAKMKEFNRTNEILLTNTEKFSSFASMHGSSYDRRSLEEAWRITLFNQFHDILPGSSIHEVYRDASESYREAQRVGNFELHRALNHITSSVNTSRIRQGSPLVIFNSLSWERSDIVRFLLPEASTDQYAVFDEAGKEVPSQIVQIDRFQREIMFRATSVPALGYMTYILRKQKPAASSGSLRVSQTEIENENLTVGIDPETGWVKSIMDKRNRREVLSAPGNRLQILEDKPSAWDAWNVGLTGVEYPSRLKKIEVIEQGPVRAVVRVWREYRKPGTSAQFPTQDFPTSFFEQDIILYAGSDHVDFRVQVDWWEEKTMLKVAFPLSVLDSAASYEIPFGSISRSTQWRHSWDSAKVEVPALRWADLSQDDYGVSLLNRAKYGHDIKGSTMRLSLLRSPKWPDPMADRGKHSVDYALFPHKGRWRDAQTVRKGYEYNAPLIAVQTESHTGSLPMSHSFVQIGPENIVLSTIKKAEDSEAWIVQWYDALGTECEVGLTLPRIPKRVVRSNVLEEDGEAVQFEKNLVKVRTRKNGIVVLKVYF
jgi:alpha-mannosidase